MGSCDDSDVIIAGGGPVGLLLACELRLAEVGVVVLERTPDGADEPRQVGGASAEASREGACVVKGPSLREQVGIGETRPDARSGMAEP
jgi:thioredoxin reductase